MSVTQAHPYSVHPDHERALRGWARAGGLLFAIVTLIAMAYSVDWKLAMLAIDPLVWMMTLVALAAGLVSGYALGMRVHARIAV